MDMPEGFGLLWLSPAPPVIQCLLQPSVLCKPMSLYCFLKLSGQLEFQGLLNKNMKVTMLMRTSWNLKESNIREDNLL